MTIQQPPLTTPNASANLLLAELEARGVRVVVGTGKPVESEGLTLAELLAGLVVQTDARLRLALLALLLYQGEGMETAVIQALPLLPQYGQSQLKLYYTVAMVLQKMYEGDLRPLLQQWCWLPNLFGSEFGLDPHALPQCQLQHLASWQKTHTDIFANWAGTFQYAAQRLITRLEKEALWTV